MARYAAKNSDESPSIFRPVPTMPSVLSNGGMRFSTTYLVA